MYALLYFKYIHVCTKRTHSYQFCHCCTKTFSSSISYGLSRWTPTSPIFSTLGVRSLLSVLAQKIVLFVHRCLARRCSNLFRDHFVPINGRLIFECSTLSFCCQKSVITWCQMECSSVVYNLQCECQFQWGELNYSGSPYIIGICQSCHVYTLHEDG